MKYQLLLLACAIGVCTYGQSSKPQFTTNPPVKGSTWDFREFLGVENGKIYQTGSTSSSFNVKCLDQETFEEEYAVEVDRRLKSRKSQFVYMEDHHGVIDVFYKDFNKESSKHQLKYRRIGKDGKLSDVKLIDEFETSKGRRGGFWHRFSANKEKVVVLGYHDYEPEAKQKYTISVYDWNFNLEWKTVHELPYTDAQFRVEDMRVTNKGEVIMIGTFSRAGERGITLFKLMEGDFQELLMEQPVKSFVGAELKPDLLPGKTQLYAWVTTDEKNGYDGYLMLTIDNETFEISNEVLEDFDSKLMAELTPEDREWGKKRPFVDFEFRDIAHRADGGLYFIAEKHYTEVTTTTDENGNESKTYTYYDLDIMVMAMDKEGNIEFLSLVPKFQKVKSGKNYYDKSSYSFLVDSGDRLHLFFNDNPENLNFKPGSDRPELMKKPEKSAVMQYVIDVDGTAKKYQIQLNTKDYIPEFREGVNLGDEILLVGQSGRKNIQYTVLSIR